MPGVAEPTVVEMVFIYKVNGVDQEFGADDLGKLPEGAVFVDRIDKVISQGYIPPIHDFTMELDGSDYKDELLIEPKLLMFVSYDLASSSREGMQQLEKLHKDAVAKGYKIIGMTASSQEEIAQVKKENNLTFDFYFCDGTTLKTIERANPSIVVLNNGTITQKLHYNDISDLKL